MDIEVTVKRLTELASWWQYAQDKGVHVRPQTMREYADETADLIEAMNGWLSSGGYLPKAWAR